VDIIGIGTLEACNRPDCSDGAIGCEVQVDLSQGIFHPSGRSLTARGTAASRIPVSIKGLVPISCELDLSGDIGGSADIFAVRDGDALRYGFSVAFEAGNLAPSGCGALSNVVPLVADHVVRSIRDQVSRNIQDFLAEYLASEQFPCAP
jgi:hypothetical protein